MRLVYLILGFVEIHVNEENKTLLLNACMEHKLSYSDVLIDEYGGIYVKFKLHDFKRFSLIAQACGIEFSTVRSGGLPIYLMGYKLRFGLLLGCVCMALLIGYFSSIIWDVRIMGNNTVTVKEIKDMLATHGVSVGERIEGIDVDKIQNSILIESDSISFISINLSGNVAEVKIIENVSPNKTESRIGFANIVAKKSGIITDIRSYEGNVVSKSGQVVNAGDILISGLYDSNIYGFRYTRASGEVMAKTVEEYYIEIPLIYDEKCYTGDVNYEKYLNFFGKNFNISKKGGKGIYIYDTIYSVDSYTLIGEYELPISIATVSRHEYETVSATRTIEEAEALAYLELEKQISSSGAEFLIKKTVTPHIGEESFSIHCVVVYIENIAETREFFVDLEN